MGRSASIRFESPLFIDCTGDALSACSHSALSHRPRRQIRSSTSSGRPRSPDAITLGSTIFFHTKDAGEPVEFVRPSFARDITEYHDPDPPDPFHR